MPLFHLLKSPKIKEKTILKGIAIPNILHGITGKTTFFQRLSPQNVGIFVIFLGFLRRMACLLANPLAGEIGERQFALKSLVPILVPCA